MLEIIVGWWPALAATVASVLAVYIRLRPPPERHTTVWLAVFVALGSTALAATLANQVMLRQERRDVQRSEQDRSTQLSEVKGQIGALLTLIPSLANGSPEQVVSAVQQTADVQSKIAALEARTSPRRLTAAQRERIRTGLSSYKGQLIEIMAIMGNNDAVRFSFDLKEAFEAAGWTVHIGQVGAIRPYFGITLIANEGSQVADRVSEVLTGDGLVVKRDKLPTEWAKKLEIMIGSPDDGGGEYRP